MDLIVINTPNQNTEQYINIFSINNGYFFLKSTFFSITSSLIPPPFRSGVLIYLQRDPLTTVMETLS